MSNKKKREKMTTKKSNLTVFAKKTEEKRALGCYKIKSPINKKRTNNAFELLL
jgi:hypothetical protein